VSKAAAARAAVARRTSSMNAPVSSASCNGRVVSAEQPMFAPPIPVGLMPEGRGELELRLQPMIERPSYRLAFLLPDEIDTHRDFIISSSVASEGVSDSCILSVP
jgi:hypothetical protein